MSVFSTFAGSGGAQMPKFTSIADVGTAGVNTWTTLLNYSSSGGNLDILYDYSPDVSTGKTVHIEITIDGGVATEYDMQGASSTAGWGPTGTSIINRNADESIRNVVNNFPMGGARFNSSVLIRVKVDTDDGTTDHPMNLFWRADQ